MTAPLRIAPVVVCFFLSGLASLVLEVVWTRNLRLVFGSTTLAASTILVAYMLGLGLGGLIGGRIAKRLRDGVRAYGWIEIAIGLYALAVPYLLAALPELNRRLLGPLGFWPAALSRFCISLALLLLPTLLMGATLPILVEALSRRDPRMGRVTALLYGVNTLGAVAGVFTATFVLFPTVGLMRSNLVGVVLGILVGLLALTVIGRRGSVRASVSAQSSATTATDGTASGPDALAAESALQPGLAAEASPPVAPTPGASRVAPPPAWMVPAIAASIGFSALVYEVAWTRALATVLGSSIYGFSSMLGAFLLGIGLGSLLIRPRLDAIRRPLLVLAAGVILLGALALVTSLVLPKLPQLYGRLMYVAHMSPMLLTIFQVAICVAVMLPPTLVLGALFPLVARVAALRGAGAAEAVGQAYFANTLGSATGAFCAGFLLIPTIGLARTLASMVALNLASGAALLVGHARAPAWGRYAAAPALVAAAALLAFSMPFDHLSLTKGVFQDPDSKLEFGVPGVVVPGVPDEELVFYRDGVSATVSVHRLAGRYLSLRTNGKADASDHADMGTQVLLGEVPLLFGPRARKVLVIGYASGVTVGSVARHPDVEQIDVLEIEPAMIEASRFFDKQSGKPLEDPRVRVIVDDGRAYLAGTAERYDLIISEPSNPWISGVSNLFTREFFQAARRALAPRGHLLQWIQLYGLEPRALRSILAAVSEEFAQVYGFTEKKGGADLIVLAGQEPLRAGQLPRLEKLPEKVRSDLRRIGILSEEDLLSLVTLLPEDVAAAARASEIVNTDDNLHIELAGPWMIQSETVTSNWEAFGDKRSGVLKLLGGTPLDAEALGRLAIAYARRGDIAVATHTIAAAEKRGRAGTSVAAATLVAAQIAGDRLPLERRLASLDDAVQRSPGSIDVRLVRAEALEEADRYAEMEQEAAAALALDSADQRARLVHARSLALVGRSQEAIEELDALLALPEMERIAAQEDDVGELAARLQMDTGQYDRAIATLEHHLRVNNPLWPEGWLMLAKAYSETGRPDDGLRAAATAMGVQKSIAVRVARQARAARRRGFPELAQVLLEQAHLIDSQNATVQADRDELARSALRSAATDTSAAEEPVAGKASTAEPRTGEPRTDAP